MTPSSNDYASAAGAAAEHPADPKIVGPSTDPQVIEMGPIINGPVADPPPPAEFEYVDSSGKKHDTVGEMLEASMPSGKTKSEKLQEDREKAAAEASGSRSASSSS